VTSRYQHTDCHYQATALTFSGWTRKEIKSGAKEIS